MNPCIYLIEGHKTRFQDFITVRIPWQEMLNSAPEPFDAILADETHRLCKIDALPPKYLWGGDEHNHV